MKAYNGKGGVMVKKFLYREKRFKKGVPKFFIFGCIYGKYQKFLYLKRQLNT